MLHFKRIIFIFSFLFLLSSCKNTRSVDIAIDIFINSLEENKRDVVEIYMPFTKEMSENGFTTLRESFSPFFDGNFTIRKQPQDKWKRCIVFISSLNDPENDIMLSLIPGTETKWIITPDAHYKQTIDFIPLSP